MLNRPSSQGVSRGFAGGTEGGWQIYRPDLLFDSQINLNDSGAFKFRS